MTDDKRFAPGTFCWVDLMAREMASAKEFYGNLFGWQCQDQDTQGGPPYGIFTFNGKGVAGIGQMDEEMKAKNVPPAWNNYVMVESVEATVEEAKKLGATITVPPMQVGPAGWLAFLQDPTGAHFALWQAGNHCGAEHVNDSGGFCWNELMTRDAAKAKEFYSKLFGWEWIEMQMPTGTYHMFKNAGRECGGMMEIGKDMGEVPPHWLTYFAVPSCDDAAKKVETLGGTIMVPGTDIPVGRFSVVTDPQGAVLALFQGKG